MNFTNLKKKQVASTRYLNLHECLAKTFCNDRNEIVLGRDVLSHCLIVGHVARALLSRMSPTLKNHLYPLHSELISASHDIGKVCPTFQEKVRRGKNNSANYQHNSYPGLEEVNPDWEEKWGYHAGLSQITLNYCKVGKFIPEIVGQHHGFSPPRGQVEISSANDERFGGANWQLIREDLIENLKSAFKANWPIVKDDKQARLIAGLTTVADWIGSTSTFDDPKNDQWKIDIEKALDLAGFYPLQIKKRLSFEQVFPNTPNPRLIQKKLIDACQIPVYVLEAPMGIGKTEAALYASYKILESGQASGIYFALPTQLTSDKIFERFNQFLANIIPVDSSNRKATLAHANAKLKMLDFGEEGAPGGSWFSSHKRELLAPFGVGTIDQALMSVLNVKHGFVRAFGLAGKVVILDEIHSYDAYTGTLIDTLVEHLVAWKCTVIILSATLTKVRRQKLLSLSNQRLDDHYPLISIKTKEQFSEIKLTPDKDKKVKIQLCHNTYAAIDEVLKRAQRGEHILWIENTVQESQEVYKTIASNAAELGIECGLLHSRFTRFHRDQIEAAWINLFGKNSGKKRLEKGRILVGTQILEQSLDIDADFLVTRLSPIDMLLQRIGRLWRHQSTIRPFSAKQEVWILSPELIKALKDPKNELGKSYHVYNPYYLLRTLELLTAFSGSFFVLPNHIRNLIESTYAERDESGLMRNLKNELEKRKETLQRLANVGLSKNGRTQSDDWSPTRYCEQETCEVLIIQKKVKDASGITLTLINGETLFLTSSQSTRHRKQISLKLQQHIVKVAKNLAPSSTTKIDWMKNYLYISDHEENTLRIVKLHPSEELLSLENVSFSKRINYNSSLGYYVEEQGNDSITI